MQPGTSLPAIEVAARSDPGRDPEKAVNEDACDYRETRFGHLSVVCDGMGGHAGGREASTLALATIFEAFEAAPTRDDLPSGARGRELLREAILMANRKVFALGGAPAASGVASELALAVGRPGSTVVALLVHASGTEVAHVGDSRAYLIHGPQITQLTKDHSMVQKMVDAALLSPEEAAVHPDANKITRALGTLESVEVDLRAEPVAHVAGDVFLLCSDGLSDLVLPKEMLEIAGGAPAAQAAGQLVDLANARGGHDNITVVVARTRESALGRQSGGADLARGTQAMREAVQPTVTQTMPESPVPLGARADRPRALTPMEPPAEENASLRPVTTKRPLSPRVILSALLGVVGLTVAAIALYLALDPHRGKPNVPPTALSPLPHSLAAPTTSLEALEPDPAFAPSAEDAAPVAPLPSLVPAKPRHP